MIEAVFSANWKEIQHLTIARIADLNAQIILDIYAVQNDQAISPGNFSLVF